MSDGVFEVRMESGDALRLTHAVLIYSAAARNSEAAFATYHDVACVDDRPMILPGKAMTAARAVSLARSLAKSVAFGGWLPDNVLYLDGDLVIWWLAPHRRHIAFKTSEAKIGERGGTVPHPGLVFAASSRTWCVWAVKGSRRPTGDTKLYRAPYKIGRAHV